MKSGINYTILDNQLGVSSGSPSGKFAVIGVSSIVPDGIISIDNYKKADEVFGDGPLRDFLADTFSLTKRPDVYALALTGSIPGECSDVSKNTNNTGVGTIAIDDTSDPRNEYDIEVIIDVDGGLNEGVFHLVIDGKELPRVTIPLDGKHTVENTGIILSFNAGTPTGEQKSYIEGDIFTFSTIAPRVTTTEILTAVETMLIEKNDFEFLVIVGETEKDLWIALNTRMLMLESENRYVFVVCQARYKKTTETTDQYINALVGDERGNFSAICLQVVAGFADVHDLNGQVDVRNVLGKYCAHLAAVCKVQERPGKTKLGAIPGITKYYPTDLTDSQISSLDDAGYVTLCKSKSPNKKGLYFTRGRMMSNSNSDFGTIPQRRVMNKTLTLVYEKQFEYLNDDVAIGKDGSPEGLDYFIADSKLPLQEMKRNGEISSFSLEIPPGQNILSNETLETKIAIVPKGYFSKIEGTIHYSNPAITGGE